jgi:LuxR family maltose regulon positive regulatory protein
MPTIFEPAVDAGNMVAARTTFRRDAARAAVVSRPALWERLDQSARATVVSAPPGSGKTVLLRSWIDAAGLAERAAWVPVSRDERDPQRFWLAVLDALRQTAPGSGLIRELTPAPDLDGWAIVERLLTDLARLEDRLWLVIDDVQALDADQARRQLELLLMRAPPELRFVLATRHDLRLGLHRLRLEGELTEIRAGDLRFSPDEARELLTDAGVQLTDPALARLTARTEGWAAGLRLAALSLAGHPDPEGFAAQFSGSERTVAEYLLAEVLDRQPEDVRRLLLRTSVLDRVNGELADLLTGGSGGEQVLHALERAGAFVVAVDAARSWFCYHRLFADLLRLQLRRAEPGEVAGLHELAATWLAGHGFGLAAVRQAQAARDWGRAARLLADYWPGLYLDGQAATIHELAAGFPAGARTADAELAAVSAADELAQGSLAAAERYLALAERGLQGEVPSGRRGQAQLLLGVVRLLLARQGGDLPAAAEQARRLEAQRLEATAGLGEELRALALVSLGITEVWADRFEEARGHLEQGVSLARQIKRPFLEFSGLAYQAVSQVPRSFAQAAERGRQAIELARRHGWTDEVAAGHAYATLATVLAWQGRLDEAAAWVQRAESTIKSEAEPAAAMMLCYNHMMLDLAHGRDADALAAFRAAERLAGRLSAPHLLVPSMQALLLLALVRLGETERAGHILAGLDEHDRDRGDMRVAAAVLRLAEDDPHAAIAALAPALDGSASVARQGWLIEAFLVEAIAHDTLGDLAAAARALERALDQAEPDGMLTPFLLHPAPGLLARQAREGTAHAALIAEILGLLSGSTPAPRGAGRRPLLDPLSKSELRVLRYLPTHLSAPEIAGELYVSPATVKTHLRNLYAKLGVHSRTDAVQAARALGLLAPAPQAG